MNSKCPKCHKGSSYYICDCGWDKENHKYIEPNKWYHKLFAIIIIIIILTIKYYALHY